jgi:hypothetical protein
MHQDDFYPTKGKQRAHKKNKLNQTSKVRDRFGKQKKNRVVEEDSIEHLNEFLDGEFDGL